MMESGNENRVAGVASKPVNFRDRQALKDIRNVVVPPYPSAINKRGLSEKNVMSKKPNLAIQRPITRKFAATLANKTDQISNGESEVVANEKDKKPASIMPLGSDKYSAIVVDYDQVSDLPLPMVESSDEMEYEPVKEVVMEDLVMESAVDIDSGDSKNPLAVVDYVDEIYSYYKRVEVTGCVNPDYMSNQFDINDKMRAILIDWLIEVHYKFELMDETLYLTVNIIDRFLARQAVVRKKLQLVGVTAMLLACKYEEISVPVVDDLIQISDRAYTREEILQMERLMVNTLQFNMSVPTPYVFMTRYLKAAADSSDKKLELLSFYMIELCLVEYQMLKFQPSLLAAAAIYTAHCSLRGCKIWTKTSELYSTYSEDQLMECSKMMVDFHQKAGEGKLTGVFRKYSTFKFGCAAKSEPAIFLLDKVL